jgi:hypothetical protein
LNLQNPPRRTPPRPERDRSSFRAILGCWRTASEHNPHQSAAELGTSGRVEPPGSWEGVGTRISRRSVSSGWVPKRNGGPQVPVPALT